MRKPKDNPFRTLDDPEPRGIPAQEPDWMPPSGACWMLRTIANERPNAWRRFWAWALTGCKWERIE
jgi:hypothetical protein